PDGDVQNRILFVPREYKESELIEASNFFNEHFSGRSFSDVRALLSGQLSSLSEDIIRLMNAAIETGASTAVDEADSVVIAVENKLLSVDDMTADRDCLRQLFLLFEK